MTTSNTPDQRIDDQIEGIIARIKNDSVAFDPDYDYPEAVDDIKQVFKSLFETMCGDIISEDEPVPTSIFDYGDDDQRKWWYNRLKTEQRQRIPQVINKYFNTEEK